MLKPKIAPMGWNSWDCYGAASICRGRNTAHAELSEFIVFVREGSDIIDLWADQEQAESEGADR